MFQESTKQENPGKVESATERRTTQRSGICVLIILSNFLTPEKKVENKLKKTEKCLMLKKVPQYVGPK